MVKLPTRHTDADIVIPTLIDLPGPVQQRGREQYLTIGPLLPPAWRASPTFLLPRESAVCPYCDEQLSRLVTTCKWRAPEGHQELYDLEACDVCNLPRADHGVLGLSFCPSCSGPMRGTTALTEYGHAALHDGRDGYITRWVELTEQNTVGHMDDEIWEKDDRAVRRECGVCHSERWVYALTNDPLPGMFNCNRCARLIRRLTLRRWRRSQLTEAMAA